MRRFAYGTLILACATFTLGAAPVTYNVAVNTSALAGTTGSLDLNFNPGPLVSQSASLQIFNFANSGTVAGAPTLTGDSSGSLPGTVTLDNGSGFNDYFQAFNYGSSLSFSVSLYGPALAQPNGTASSGSTLAFSLFSDPTGSVPAFTTDLTDGFACVIDVNLDGWTSVTDYLVNATETPEPGTSGLGAIALLFALGSAKCVRRFHE